MNLIKVCQLKNLLNLSNNKLINSYSWSSSHELVVGANLFVFSDCTASLKFLNVFALLACLVLIHKDSETSFERSLVVHLDGVGVWLAHIGIDVECLSDHIAHLEIFFLVSHIEGLVLECLLILDVGEHVISWVTMDVLWWCFLGIFSSLLGFNSPIGGSQNLESSIR